MEPKLIPIHCTSWRMHRPTQCFAQVCYRCWKKKRKKIKFDDTKFSWSYEESSLLSLRFGPCDSASKQQLNIYGLLREYFGKFLLHLKMFLNNLNCFYAFFERTISNQTFSKLRIQFKKVIFNKKCYRKWINYWSNNWSLF